MKRKRKHPEFIYMIVSIAAFVCTAVAIIVFSHTSGIYTRFSFEITAVLVFVLILVLPVVIRAYAYSSMFRFDRRENNFSASYAINEYKLTGWIKGKYTFLEAVSEACNGNFERGFELYVDCLGDAEDKRLRRACYKDMVKYLMRMDNNIRILPYILRGCEEFPDEKDLFECVSSYYIFFRYADEKEALEWFGKVIESSSDDEIKSRAYYYRGVSKLFSKHYDLAESDLEKAHELSRQPRANICMDLAVCKGCLGKYDESREFAVQSVSVATNRYDIENISEQITYLFKAKTQEVNPEIEKLINELKRRRDNDAENSMNTETIENLTEAIETIKQINNAK